MRGEAFCEECLSDSHESVGLQDVFKHFQGDKWEKMQMEMTPENQKHLNEELKPLRDMLLIVEKPVKHTFTTIGAFRNDMLTSPGMEQLTIDVMPRNVRDAAKAMRGGVRILAERPKLFGIRTVKGFIVRFCANPLKTTDYRWQFIMPD